MEKAKKPRSAAQKEADRRYYEKTDKHRRKHITFRLTVEEHEEIKNTLQAHNLSALQLFRKAIEELKKGNL